MKLPQDFLSLSQQIGADPMLVQGAGGNTSVKLGDVMWIKASGTELANAAEDDIFVAVDIDRARQELDGAGDGTCRSARIDQSSTLRPSIETTFHALLPDRFVFHFHSVAAICHAISNDGRALLDEKLGDLNRVRVPYRKPGLPLSEAIRSEMGDRRVNVIVLDNHGIIITGNSLDEVQSRIYDVEARLHLPVCVQSQPSSNTQLPDSWEWSTACAALATDSATFRRAVSGSYYPDHVVFLGPALPSMKSATEMQSPTPQRFPAAIIEGEGVCLKREAVPGQRVMLQCLHDVLVRTPADWELSAIGPDAEAELLNWDAEKYRQELAVRSGSA